MAETPKQSDQSMEEILQSIKRIIAEEGDDTVTASNVDDVLELTDRVADEDIAAQNGEGSAPISVDALLDSLADPSHVPPAEPMRVPTPMATPASGKELQAETISALEALEGAMAEEVAVQPASTISDEGIASQKTLSASAAALKQLKPEPQAAFEHHAERIAFRSGLTLEDLVLEALRPMLREWVDANLPGMVESMVAREIAKIRTQL